jgi:hypothetical protein
LESEDVPPPGNEYKASGRFWYTNFLGTVVKDDVYKPHASNEIAELVAEGLLAEEVAASLDESSSYGIFWFNQARTIRKRVTKVGSTGKEYRWQRKTYQNPRDQWIAIPVPDAGIPREIVEAAREMLRYNAVPSKKGRRFYEIPSGVVRCDGCANAMGQHITMANGKVYAYYKCARLVQHGKDGCSPERLRTNHRAEDIERKVWSTLSDLMSDPEQLRGDIDRMIELEKNGSYSEPQQEEKAWLDKLAEVNQMRRGYQEQAAIGHMTFDELGVALSDLEETRKSVERELHLVRNRLERVEQLERDKDALHENYFGIAPDALEALTPEERHDFYKIVRLQVTIYPNCDLEISWAGGEGLLFSTSELVRL